MSHQQSIPCPVCRTAIVFDTMALLAGAQFTCPQCHAAIGMAESSIPMAKKAMRKFEVFRESTEKIRKDYEKNRNR